MRALICDFTVSKTLDGGRTGLTTTYRKLTTEYASPEVMEDPSIRMFKSDVWSFGCLMYHVRPRLHKERLAPSLTGSNSSYLSLEKALTRVWRAQALFIGQQRRANSRGSWRTSPSPISRKSFGRVGHTLRNTVRR